MEELQSASVASSGGESVIHFEVQTQSEAAHQQATQAGADMGVGDLAFENQTAAESDVGITLESLKGATVEPSYEEPQGEELSYGKSYEEKQEEARRVLTEIYSKHAPRKVKDIDNLLEAYSGQEDELIAVVKKKYGGGGTTKPRGGTNQQPRPTARKENTEPAGRRRSFNRSRSALAGAASAMSKKLPQRRRSTGKKFESAKSMEGFGSSEKVAKAGMVTRAKTIFRRHSRTSSQGSVDMNSPRMAMPAPTHKRGWRSSSLPPQRRNSDSSQNDFGSGLGLGSGVGGSGPGGLEPLVFRCDMKGKDRLVAFFERFDPDMLGSVDALMQHGGKTEEQMWNELQARYKVNQRDRLLKLLQICDQSKVKNVDEVLASYEGREELLIEYYRQKYQPLLEKMEPDPKTWATGAANTYQMLPGRDLGD